MIPLNPYQKAALNGNIRVEHIHGTIDGAFDFYGNNVISLTYSNRCSSTDDITFGLAYIGQITATFRDVSINRGLWTFGREIFIEWGFDYTDENDEVQTRWIPLGKFYIASAEWDDFGVNVVANDVISKLDKDFGGTQTGLNTIGWLARFACQQCGVTWGMTDAEAEALPNGSASLRMSDKNDVKTWRDYLAWLASTAGGFLTADRNGNVIIRSFAYPGYSDSWGTGQRIQGAVFADFDTAYDGVSYQDIATNSKIDMPGINSHGSGHYIQLGANPFIQDNPGAVKVLADLATELTIAPFSASLLSTMVYDLGDVVENYGGLAGTNVMISILMGIDWEYKNLTKFSCYGSDPALQAGKSQTDKALNGLQSQIKADVIEFVKFINSERYTIDSVETDIAELRFGLVNTRDVETWAEIKFKATSPAKITIKYYYDGELVAAYSPEETFEDAGALLWITDEVLNYKSGTAGSDKIHTANYHYHLNNVSSGTAHRWRITVTAETGEIEIPIGGVHVVMWAPGMISENAWAGYISASDEIPFLKFKPLDLFGELSDSATTRIESSDTLITENGDILTTEAGEDITMANIELLPDAEALDGTEYIPVVQNGQTVKITTQNLADLGGN